MTWVVFYRSKGYNASSNNNFLGLLIGGGGETKDGLSNQIISDKYQRKCSETVTHILVPHLAAGLPMQLIVRLFQPGETEADAEEQSVWL